MSILGSADAQFALHDFSFWIFKSANRRSSMMCVKQAERLAEAFRYVAG